MMKLCLTHNAVVGRVTRKTYGPGETRVHDHLFNLFLFLIFQFRTFGYTK